MRPGCLLGQQGIAVCPKQFCKQSIQVVQALAEYASFPSDGAASTLRKPAAAAGLLDSRPGLNKKTDNSYYKLADTQYPPPFS